MSGKLYGLGVGPGDPELLTLKAHRVLQSCGVVAYPAPDKGDSFARMIVANYLPKNITEIAIRIPMRVERYPAQEIYDQKASEIAIHLQAYRDVAVLCEGDPFFYGSFMYIFERLAQRFDCEIIPGVSSLSACASALPRPLASRNDVLSILPAPLDDRNLQTRIEAADSLAIMKIGRHLPRIRELVTKMGLIDQAGYVERASLPNQIVTSLKAAPEQAPYFSMVLIYKGQEEWLKKLPVMQGDANGLI